MSIDTATRNNIILGAVSMTGPVGDSSSEWDTRLIANAKRLTTLLSDGSNVARTIQILDEAKKFVGTIVYVGKEKTSKRGFVVIKTGTDRDEHGLETVRTEIVEGNDSVTAFAKDLRENMIGHRVLLYVEMQVGKTPDKKFRILQHVDDLGEDTSITDEDLENGRARAAKDMKR
ncbi:hypothetical protein [Pseudarthrobacter sp. BIM B-2242]|uniref:hypothetical protein n=1 Tax=Pseudarthrobacter sp. BIM B-2242 TaxID=2772401 RepID=UPI00168BBFC2|nr:hypothetical protein [Pseudarthrobacter sp. BIM B-2242]QOD05915.1 hypothetical protein IDT60_20305 [Pseudarthrobacter sp. BIM B-2242]